MKLKASALVVTMLILGIILITALSISLVSVKERKASLGSNNSDQAFNTAQSGVESVLQQIKTNSSGTLADIFNSTNDCPGTISSGGYSVKLMDSSGNIVSGCSTPVSQIANLKSVGTYGQDQRAIEVAVASTNTCAKNSGNGIYVGVTSGTYNGNMSKFITGVNGYTGANSLCQASYPNSHLCMGVEILKTINCGGSVPDTGWVSAGTHSIYSWNTTGNVNVNTAPYDDCIGWTTTNSAANGNIWRGGSSLVDGLGCDGTTHLLCCN